MIFNKYNSRYQAGEILAKNIETKEKKLYDAILEQPEQFFCFAIPNGGVPVAEGFCDSLNINYDLVIVRKIKIPYNTEAGFGSVTTDGSVLVNQSLLNQLGLTERQVRAQINLTKQEIKERLEFYNKKTNLESSYEKLVSNKTIFMIDDGLASGFTVLAAIKMIHKYSPKSVNVVVPTAPKRTIESIQIHVENIFYPNIRNTMRFAVAEAYKHWYDLSEKEVLNLIKTSKHYVDNLSEVNKI